MFALYLRIFLSINLDILSYKHENKYKFVWVIHTPTLIDSRVIWFIQTGTIMLKSKQKNGTIYFFIYMFPNDSYSLGYLFDYFRHNI